MMRPCDAERVGLTGAYILALIRFETTPGDEHHGRHVADGVMWWQATHAEIAAALRGVTACTVQRHLSKLEQLGELVSCVLIPGAEQTKAYRVPDQSEQQNAVGLTSQNSKMRQGVPQNAVGPTAKCGSAPLLPEEQKITEEPPYPPLTTSPSQPLTPGVGKALAKANQLNATARPPEAQRIAEAFSRSLPTPIEAHMLGSVAAAIGRCLASGIPTPAIAEGLKAWNASDSWSPTQIPHFVHKANNRPRAPATSDQRVAAILAMKSTNKRNGRELPQ